MKEPYTLAWPEDWPRTLLRDRQERKAWKDTLLQTVTKLRKELHRSKALSFVISCNIPPSGPTVDSNTGRQLDYKFLDVPPPPDVGVAVWFSRQRKDDYSWQETLHITSPAPSEKEILDAFKRAAAKFHPDNPYTGDGNIYMRYDEAKKKALDFISRKTGTNYQRVIAIDTFNEVRLNMQAVRMALAYLRGLETCGAPMILERAFEGFAAQIAERSETHG